MDDPSPWIPIWISALSAAVAVWALVVARVSSAKSNEIQSQVLDLERAREADRLRAQGRAEVVAFMVSSGGSKTLYLRNEGRAIAEAVQVTIDGIELRNHPRRVGQVPQEVTLSPKAETRFHLSAQIPSPSHIRVETTWRDASGVPGRWFSDLSF